MTELEMLASVSGKLVVWRTALASSNCYHKEQVSEWPPKKEG